MFNLFAISKWLYFCFYILTKNQQTCQIKKMAPTKNNIDYYNMRVILVHLNAYGSSSLDKPNCVLF